MSGIENDGYFRRQKMLKRSILLIVRQTKPYVIVVLVIASREKNGLWFYEWWYNFFVEKHCQLSSSGDSQESVAHSPSSPLNPSLLVAVTQSRLSWHLHTEWHLARWQTTTLVAPAPTVDTMRSPIGRRFSVVLAPSRRNILI